MTGRQNITRMSDVAEEYTPIDTTVTTENLGGLMGLEHTSTSTETVATSGMYETTPNDITFHVGNNLNQQEILKLCENGDIFVDGKKIVNDIQVHKALLRWSSHMNAEAVDADELEQILRSTEYKRFYRLEHRKHQQPGQTFIDYVRKCQHESGL